MGLKEDMEAEAPSRPTVEVRKVSKPKQDAAVTHEHGNGICEEAWIDEDNRRRVRPAQGRIPKYVATCKACQAEDQKRMAAPAPDIDPETTVFLVPERAYDAAVIRAYLGKRFEGKDLFVSPTLRPARLAVRKDAMIVVMNRRRLPGSKGLGEPEKLVEDKFGNPIRVPVDPSEYVSEVVEAAPINVSDLVTSSAATMYSDEVLDLSELRLTLCDLAAPGYTIMQHQRTEKSDEVEFVMRALT